MKHRSEETLAKPDTRNHLALFLDSLIKKLKVNDFEERISLKSKKAMNYESQKIGILVVLKYVENR